MTSTSTRVAVALLLALFQVNHSQAQEASDPWYAGQQKPPGFGRSSLLVSKGTFSIEVPEGWQRAPGHANTILTSVEKKTPGAMITLEHTLLSGSVREDPELMEKLKNGYLQDVKGVESGGKDFTASVKRGNFGYFILIQYLRQDFLGESHVSQYLFPVGSTMYSLVCVAPFADIEKKYRRIFGYVANSFKPLTASAK